jgi:hypothetical protein
MAQVITLKHAGQCIACRRPLPAGQRAYWQKSHGVACLQHGPGGIAAAERKQGVAAQGTSNARSGGSTRTTTRSGSEARRRDVAPPDQPQWAAYCDYLVACVEVQHAATPLTLESPDGWLALAGHEIPIVSGEPCDVDLPVAVVARGRAGDASFSYGWPLLVLPDDRGRHQLVPLFVLASVCGRSERTRLSASAL